MRHITRLAIALLLALAAGDASAAERYAGATGNWNSNDTWGTSCTASPTGGSDIPVAGDNVHLCPGKTVTVPCAYDPVLGTLVDEADSGGFSWATDGGGLSADGSACSANGVPVWTFDNAGLTTVAIRLRYMTENATFVMKGRAIYDEDDGARLGVMDFTPSGCAAGETTCFLTYINNDPYDQPASVTTVLNPGTYTDFDSAPTNGFRLMRMTTGQHRGDVYIVQSIGTGPSRVRFTPGALGDMYGGALGLKAPKDIGAGTITWTNTNTWRLSAAVPTGTIWGTTTNHYGEGQCLVMDRGSTYPGNYYRVASSTDGGGSADTLVFDEHARLLPADATNPAAWLAPCLRPGDAFEAGEPMALMPATPGTDAVNLWVDGAQVLPDLEWLYLPRAAPVDLNDSNDTDSVLVFQDANGVQIDGPISVIGLNNVDVSTAPQVLGIFGTSNSRFSKITGSGYYNPNVTGTGNVWHFLMISDSQNVTVDKWSASWGNNECSWTLSSADTAPADRPYEGVDGVLSNGTCHNLWILATETSNSDTGRGVTIDMTAGVPGRFDLRDNLVWAVSNVGITTSASSTAGEHEMYVYNNVVGSIHPDKQVDTGSTQGIATNILAGGGAHGTSYTANNVVLKSISQGSLTSLGLDQTAHAFYSYIAEHTTPVRTTNIANGISSPSHYGLLVDLGGPGTVVANGIETQRKQQGSTTHTMRDIVMRRGCDFSGSGAIRGIRDSATPTTTANVLDWRNFTIGMWCSEAQGNDEGAPAAGSGAINFAETDQLSTSTFRDLLLVTGDHLASDSDADNADYSTFGVIGSATCTTNCITDLANTVCSANRIGASTQSNCVNGLGTITNTNFFQAGTYPSAIGILDDDLLTLRRESQAFALSDTTMIGARYAGISLYTDTMRDMGLQRRLLSYQATGVEEPDFSVVPSVIRGAIGADVSRGITRPIITRP